MAREVTHDATGPLFLDEDDIDDEKGDVAVCRCGLSDERPFCDGSHRAAEDEDPDARYKYVDGERREVVNVVLAGPDGGESGGGADPADAAGNGETG